MSALDSAAGDIAARLLISIASAANSVTLQQVTSCPAHSRALPSFSSFTTNCTTFSFL